RAQNSAGGHADVLIRSQQTHYIDALIEISSVQPKVGYHAGRAILHLGGVDEENGKQNLAVIGIHGRELREWPVEPRPIVFQRIRVVLERLLQRPASVLAGSEMKDIVEIIRSQHPG